MRTKMVLVILWCFPIRAQNMGKARPLDFGSCFRAFFTLSPNRISQTILEKFFQPAFPRTVSVLEGIYRICQKLIV